MSDEIPFVAVGAGERAPWADAGLACPKCGGPELELRDSDPPGLTYIKCERCGGSWLRGQPNFKSLFGRKP
jgi:DNA-directed RNA polymerase subunit RPC12/RpoP